MKFGRKKVSDKVNTIKTVKYFAFVPTEVLDANIKSDEVVYYGQRFINIWLEHYKVDKRYELQLNGTYRWVTCTEKYIGDFEKSGLSRRY
jgi:hypothetical protein